MNRDFIHGTMGIEFEKGRGLKYGKYDKEVHIFKKFRGDFE